MAKRFLLLPPLLSTILLLALTVTESEAYSQTTPFEGHKPEKHTHFHFYFHDITTGANATAVLVASAPVTNSSSTYFGSVMVLDNPLTEGPDRSSKEIGRAQGFYASSGMKTAGLTMALNFLFTEGEFNGSYVAMYGRNSIYSKLREMPIIGGSGALRFARGYAQAKTYSFVGLNAVVEYNVFVWH